MYKTPNHKKKDVNRNPKSSGNRHPPSINEVRSYLIATNGFIYLALGVAFTQSYYGTHTGSEKPSTVRKHSSFEIFVGRLSLLKQPQAPTLLINFFSTLELPCTRQHAGMSIMHFFMK